MAVDPASSASSGRAPALAGGVARSTDQLIRENSTRTGVDTRSLAADLTDLPPAQQEQALHALARRLTPAQQGEVMRHLDGFAQAMPASAPPPEDRSMSLGDHVVDGVHQFGSGVWSMVKGVGGLAVGVARTAYDASPAGYLADGVAGMMGGQVPSWLPSGARGEARIGDAANMIGQAGKAIWNDPSILLNEYKQLAGEGRYGAIVGQAFADFGDLLVGTHGAGAAAHGAEAVADVARIAHGAGIVADAGKVARASESAVALARAAKADAAFAERAHPALEQARAALGAVDEARLAPEAREALSHAKAELDGALTAAAPRYMEHAAAEMPKFTANFGREILQLAVKSPSLMQDLRALERAGWTIEKGVPGTGTRALTAGKRIVLDPLAANTPARTVQLIAHEIGHAKFAERADFSSRAAYVAQRLRDEGAATLENIRVQREIKGNGGGDIALAGNQANHAAYNQAYDAMLASGDARTAQEAIGRQFATGERASGTGMNYEQFYGAQYARMFPGRP